VSLNGADVTNAIATVSYYAAGRYDSTALQELNMVCAKQDTFRTLTTRHGYSCCLACFSDSVDQSGRAICPFLQVVWFFWSVRVIEHPQSTKGCALGCHVVTEVGEILVGTAYRCPSSASTHFIVHNLEFFDSVPHGRPWRLFGEPHDSSVVDNLCCGSSLRPTKLQVIAVNKLKLSVESKFGILAVAMTLVMIHVHQR